MPASSSVTAAAAEEILKGAQADAPDVWVQVIHEAAQSPLGIFALMILVLAFIAYAFFRRGPVFAKLSCFFTLALGVAGWGWAMYEHPQSSPPDRVATAETHAATPTVEFSATRQIRVCTTDRAWTGWIRSGTTPPDPCRPNGCALGQLLSRDARIVGFPPTSEVNYLFACRKG